MSSILGGQCPHVRGGMRGSCEVVDLVNWLLGIWSKSEVSGQIGGPNSANFDPPRYPKFTQILGFFSGLTKKTRKNVSGHPFFLEPRGNYSNFQGRKSCLMRYCLVCTPPLGGLNPPKCLCNRLNWDFIGQIGGIYDNLAKNPKISIIWGVWSKTQKKHVYLGVEIRGLGRIWTPEIVKKVTISDPLKMRTLASKDRRNQLADKDLRN